MSAHQKPERPIQVTPGRPDDSQIIEFPGDSWQAKVKKWGGVFAIFAGFIASIWGAQSWFTTTINASAEEVKVEIKEVEQRVNGRIDEKLEAHAAHPHAESVPREVYELHVEAQKEANVEIQKKLDLIGEGTYRSPSKWERKLEREGLKPEDER